MDGIWGWEVQLVHQAERADISELNIAKGLEEKYIYEAHRYLVLWFCGLEGLITLNLKAITIRGGSRSNLGAPNTLSGRKMH